MGIIKANHFRKVDCLTKKNKAMFSKSISIILLLTLIVACNKEISQKMESHEMEEHFHGYLYIGCEGPPYYLKLDSLIANCSSSGLLPDSLPLPIMRSVLPNSCRFDNNKGIFGAADNYDLRIGHEGYTIQLESLLPNTAMESIPFEITEMTLEAGEPPYLGGYKLLNDEWSITIQVINEYVGGCFHNTIIWELTKF